MDMKFSRVLLAFLCLTAAVHAEYILQVDVERLSNPHLIDHNGDCCEHPCGNICDYYFIFCLQPLDYPFSFCPLGGINTQDGGTITDQPLTFNDMILGHNNPLSFRNTDPWPGSLQLRTTVMDSDIDSNDLIDVFISRLTLSISDQFTGSMTYQGVDQSSITMTFRFRAICATNFFGPDCTVFCQGRDDATGHYTCDANGDEVCLDGYENPDSNCVTPVCAEGCDPTGGFCEVPGECRCEVGWSGDLCDTCIPAAGCVNGNCNTPGECICNAGYSGTLCQIDEDVCAHQSPCQNGATCTSTGPDEYECDCPAGYTGVDCQDDIDDCASTPCLNGGSCEDRLNGFVCNCSRGWEGLTCGDNINECLTSDPCLNGGTCRDCTPTTPSLGGPGDPGTGGEDCLIGYICDCPTGYFGDMCEGDFDYCMSDPCQNEATCHDQETDYRCACALGFTGMNCETEVDECDPNPCLNGGTCEDRLANYTCDCATGFTGRDCGQNIDDCPGNECVADNTQRCEDGINSYTCICHPGFTGQFCEDDIDDCDSSPCLEGSTCVDLVNDFLCECAPGFTGPLCSININDCVSPDLCLNSGTCIDKIEGYDCDCVPGFTGRQCETSLPPPCQSNPCGDNEFCVDMGPANFRCAVCMPGDGGVCVPTAPPEEQGGDKNVGVIIGAVIGGIVGAILLVCLLCCCWFFFLAAHCDRNKVEEHETTIGYDTMKAVGNQNPIYFGPNTLLSSRGSTLSSQGSDSLNRRSVQVQNPAYADPGNSPPPLQNPMYALPQNPPLPPRNGSFSPSLPLTDSTDQHHYDTIPALHDGPPGAPQSTTFGHGYARLENVNSRDGTPTMALASGKYDNLKDSKEGLPLLSANGSDSPLTSARGARATENPYVASPLIHSTSQTDPLDSEDKIDKQEVLSVPQPRSSSSENPYVAHPE